MKKKNKPPLKGGLFLDNIKKESLLFSRRFKFRDRRHL